MPINTHNISKFNNKLQDNFHNKFNSGIERESFRVQNIVNMALLLKNKPCDVDIINCVMETICTHYRATIITNILL